LLPVLVNLFNNPALKGLKVIFQGLFQTAMNVSKTL